MCTLPEASDNDANSRSSAIRSEATLESMSRSMDHSQQIILNLSHHLSEIWQVVSMTHNAVLSQPAAAHCLSQPTLSGPVYDSTPLEQPHALPKSFGQRDEISVVDDDLHPKQKQTFPTRGSPCLEDSPRERYECKSTTCDELQNPTGIDTPKKLLRWP